MESGAIPLDDVYLTWGTVTIPADGVTIVQDSSDPLLFHVRYPGQNPACAVSHKVKSESLIEYADGTFVGVCDSCSARVEFESDPATRDLFKAKMLRDAVRDTANVTDAQLASLACEYEAAFLEDLKDIQESLSIIANVKKVLAGRFHA